MSYALALSTESMAIHIKELEKELSIALKFNAEINEFCDSLLRE
jgi:hypothetical protein